MTRRPPPTLIRRKPTPGTKHKPLPQIQMTDNTNLTSTILSDRLFGIKTKARSAHKEEKQLGKSLPTPPPLRNSTSSQNHQDSTKRSIDENQMRNNPAPSKPFPPPPHKPRPN